MAAAQAVFSGWRIILCTGDDEAAVQDAARALTARALEPDGGSFRVLDIDASQRDIALTHAATRPLGGGDPVLRLRGLGDRHAKLLSEAASLPGPSLVIAEGAGLTARSTVVKLVGALRSGQIVSCERDAAAAFVRDLASLDRSAEPAAIKRVSELAAVPGWGMLTAQLPLLALPGVPLTLEAVLSCAVHDGPEADLDTLWVAVLGGEPRAVAMLRALLDEGVAPVSIVRAGLTALHRLRAVTPGSQMSAWMPRSSEAGLRSAARRWRDGAIRLGAALNEAERACKSGRDQPALVVTELIEAVLVMRPGLG